jgi:hypothetical protein
VKAPWFPFHLKPDVAVEHLDTQERDDQLMGLVALAAKGDL